MTDAPDPESPQVEEGYFKVAHTLQIGLMLMSGHHEAKVILAEIIGQWLGKGRATTFTVDVPKIAERWGLDRTNVWRGLRQLKTTGVLIATDDKTVVKIDKYALMKLLPENVRKGLKSFAADARNGEIFGEKIDRKHRVKSDTEADETVSNLTLDSVKSDTLTVSNLTLNRVKSDTVGGGVYKEEELEEVKKQQPAPENHGDSRQGQRDGLPGNETPDDSILTAIRTLINSRIEPTQNNRQLWDNIHANRRVFPTWWIMKALKRSIIRQPGRVPKWGYLLPILQDWATSASRQPDGGPEDGYTDTLELVQFTGTVQSIPMPTLAMSPANQRRAEMKRQCMIMHERAQEEMRRNAGA